MGHSLVSREYLFVMEHVWSDKPALYYILATAIILIDRYVPRFVGSFLRSTAYMINDPWLVSTTLIAYKEVDRARCAIKLGPFQLDEP